MPNMNEMLKSIIEMDKISRGRAAQAQADKGKALDEAGTRRAAVIEERLTQAEAQANEARKEYEEELLIKLKIICEKHEKEKARLSSNFAKYRNSIIEEMYKEIIKND